MSALEDRYGKIEDESAGVIEEEMFVVGKNQTQTAVEFVGAKKVNTRQRSVELKIMIIKPTIV